MAKKENKKKKINVLLVGLMIGGAMGENFVTVASQLSKHVNAFILTNSGINQSQIKKSQNFLALPFWRYQILTFFNPLSYIRIINFILKNNIDCIYFLTPHPINILISLLFFFKRQIYYLHDPFLHSGLSKFDSYVINFEYWVISKTCRSIIVAANTLRQDMIDKKWRHYPADQIRVTYLGLLKNLVFSQKHQNKKYDLLFFGRIEPYKGLDILIKAMQTLENSGIKCCVAGQGDIGKIHPSTKKLPSNITRINKYLSNNKLAELIQQSKCVVLPYRDATGTQTIPVAFYYGVPVITTNVGSLGEYVSNNCDGLVISPEDPKQLANAISTLFKNPKLLDKLTKNTKKSFAQKFNDQEIIKSHIEIIKNE